MKCAFEIFIVSRHNVCCESHSSPCTISGFSLYALSVLCQQSRRASFIHPSPTVRLSISISLVIEEMEQENQLYLTLPSQIESKQNLT
jgi:hypothetical protein